MKEQNDIVANRTILNRELETLIRYQVDRVNSINERTGWLLVFAALNVSTLMVSSFTAFRSHLAGQSDAYEWWLDLFTLDILFYLLTIVFGYVGQRIVISFVELDNDELLFNELESHDPSDLTKRLLETKFRVFQQNKARIDQKTRYLNTAYIFLVIAVALLFVVVLAAAAL